MKKRILCVSLCLVLLPSIAIYGIVQNEVQYRSRLQTEFLVTPSGQDHWKLIAAFEFSVGEQNFTIPEGFTTDFASVPRQLWSVLSPYDLGVGCIPHDAGYRFHWANKDYWDLVFLMCMEKDGIAWWKRQAAYYAVHWFGQPAWNSHDPAPKDYKSAPMTKPFLTKGTITPDRKRWQQFIEQATEGK